MSLSSSTAAAASDAAATSATSVDVYRPSFFEMLAQERLILGLKPAVRYAIVVLARRYPWLVNLVEYHDELHLVLMYALEKHYLEHYDASFSENFYGLKRVRAHAGGRENTPLSDSDRKRALLMLTLVPYLRSRMERYYQSLVSPTTEDGFENFDVYNAETEHQRAPPERWTSAASSSPPAASIRRAST
eukprot:TRINITY_DN66564_c13_g2_i1.p1 TRINITY_DN66564_c13_g2~~TRINITY_DN66564_c13_g2_i1.p1  ORF type:complete len:189 (-),score=81.12 TRINITY_DN66564_c13_g2_i1:52-618(-)